MPFSMQTQLQTRWCWAAVASSFRDFFRVTSPIPQCEIANRVLRRTDCCVVDGAGNEDSRLETALQQVGHFDEKLEGPLTFDQLAAALDDNRPFGARIQWANRRGGHFVVVSGYLRTPSGRQLVSIRDPWYRDSLIPVEQFRNHYEEGDGSWTDTYFAKP